MKIVEVHCKLLYIILFMYVHMKETEYTEYVQKKITYSGYRKKMQLTYILNAATPAFALSSKVICSKVICSKVICSKVSPG